MNYSLSALYSPNLAARAELDAFKCRTVYFDLRPRVLGKWFTPINNNAAMCKKKCIKSKAVNEIE